MTVTALPTVEQVDALAAFATDQVRQTADPVTAHSIRRRVLTCVV